MEDVGTKLGAVAIVFALLAMALSFSVSELTTTLPAENITIADNGSHFTSDNVEGALAELATSGGGIEITTIDQTDNRALNSIYQNLTGKPMFVSVYPVYMEATAIYGCMAPTNPPWGYFGVSSAKDPDTGGSQIIMLVPPNWYYALASDGTAYAYAWTEQTLG